MRRSRMLRCPTVLLALLTLSGCATSPSTQGSGPADATHTRPDYVVPKGGSANAEPAEDQGGPHGPRGLEPEQVKRVVLSRYGAFQACLGLKTKPDRGPEDKLAIAWEIAPDGSVARSTLVGSTLGEPRVEGCMLRVVNLMKFPSAPGPTKVQFPLAYGSTPEPNETAQ